MVEDYNLYPLHVFRLVARHGSVTAAARALCISQPAVSGHVRALEARYGGSLLERTPRGVRLTPAGAALAEGADRLLAQMEDLGGAVETAQDRVRGEVAIAASSTPGAYLLPGLLRRFRDRFPEARPVLMVGDTADVLARLHDYRAPLGVVGALPGTVEEGAIHREQIADDELRLVAAADDPLCELEAVRPEHLGGHTLLLREPGSSTRAGAEALLGDLLPAFGRVAEVSSAEAIKEAVLAGLGVAVLSSWATGREEAAGLLRPVRDVRLRRERPFYLIRRADRPPVGAARALWEFLMS